MKIVLLKYCYTDYQAVLTDVLIKVFIDFVIGYLFGSASCMIVIV